MSRAEAFEAVVAVLAGSVPDLGNLVALLDVAGQKRFARALRAHYRRMPAEIRGVPRPEAEIWLRGKLL
jgi:hypothetical protein